MNQTGILRSRLREAQPALYRHFERSWEIALEEWLHTIDENLGSSNSYPHLCNIENHLNQVLLDFESLPNTAYTERLSPMEIYMLLSAVLFHDFGRTQPDTEEPGHAAAKLLGKHYAYLGIPSSEIARSLGRICAFHHPSGKKTRSVLAKYLSTTVIDPYGEVREPFLAALLTLADHMDAAFTRALPPYVAEPDEIDPVGLFRRSIRGINVDPFERLVRTVLVSDEKEKEGVKDKKNRYILRLNKARTELWKALLNVTEADPDKAFIMCENTFWESVVWSRSKDLAGLQHSLKTAGITLRIGTMLECKRWYPDVKELETRLIAVQKEKHNLLAKADLAEEKHNLLAKAGLATKCKTLDLFLVLGLLHLERLRGESHESGIALPSRAPVALVLGNMRENCEMLPDIRDALAANGIYVAAWVVEQNEHLYNNLGYETYEPIFDRDYLERVAKGMWELSGQVFGVSQFSYEDLAAHIGEPITEKVRRAVRRIAIVTRELPSTVGTLPPDPPIISQSVCIAPATPKNKNGLESDPSVGTRTLPLVSEPCVDSSTVEQKENRTGAIQAGNARWEWRVRCDANGYCQCMSLKEVRNRICKLESPQMEYGQRESTNESK